ncbi:MAG: hypothetical protein A2474_00570 [Elusimicrobia bacterium RIFOXYC2_FULL_34_12]|nr:MAG: hypothetical protein A2474_00570 [Elusimicrobia bacterium RIFOXYC2_FULL_34_12]OGS38420.1 MAG: hypothetical protein A2551_04515 [Elusimicrobia bacterium RIFOXYD2_FULL_34_30]
MNRKNIKVLLLAACCLLFLFCSPGKIYSNNDNLIRELLWKDFLFLNKTRPKIAVVLGGGGARGFSHIGVLKALQENNIPIDIIVGTSAGALIGGLYASGMDITKIEELGKDVGWNEISDLSMFRMLTLITAESLLSNNKLEKYLAKHIGKKRFDELEIPFACIACDIKTGERIIFKDGEAGFAMMVSATIPGVFKPVEYRHRLLIDGGIVDNLPVDIARILGADYIIAVYPKADFSLIDIKSILMTLYQVINIQGSFLIAEQLNNADFAIIPDVKDVGSIDLNRSKECIESGLVSTRSIINNIKDKILEKYINLIIKKP